MLATKPHLLPAQSAEQFDSAFSSLEALQEIRVFARAATVTGTFLGVSNGALAITRNGQQRRFLQAQIDSVALRSAKAKPLAIKAGIFGAFAIGALVGLIVGQTSANWVSIYPTVHPVQQ